MLSGESIITKEKAKKKGRERNLIVGNDPNRTGGIKDQQEDIEQTTGN